MSDLKKLNMSELIARHNELAEKLGVATENSFKDLKTARVAVEHLESKMEQATNPNEQAAADTSSAEQTATATSTSTAGATTAATSDPSKYNSSGKRGPNQGVGAYAKELILAGKNNADALAAVLARFPDAKTTTGCIAYYRTALAKGPAVATPEQLRAKAEALRAEATALDEKAAAAEKAEADAVAAAQAKDEAEAAAKAAAATQTAAEPA